MSWDYIRYRIRKRAEKAVFEVSSYIHGENEEESPEERLEDYLRQRAKLREYEGGIL